MSYLKDALSQKKEELNSILTELSNHITEGPEGRLRISHSNNVPQYYYCEKVGESFVYPGKYIRKDNKELACSLAQKDYERKLTRRIKDLLQEISRLESNYDVQALETVYDSMNAERRKIVKPYIKSEKDYAKEWEEQKYQGKGFAHGVAEIYTEKGERVRSKSEMIIADMLSKYGVPYRYEYPLYLKGVGNVYPDFTILDIKNKREIYWEHMGLMDNMEYCEKSLRKIESYCKNGIWPGEKLLLTHETSKRPLNTELVRAQIKKII